MDITPLLKSQVIRAVLVALAGLVGLILRKLGLGFDEAFANQLVDAVLLLITTVAAAWAGVARARLPTPPLTQVAADKTAIREAKEDRARQGGYARPAMLVITAAIGAALVLAGCVGTRDAYKASAGNLEATAYVVTEHYAAVVKEAAAMKNSGALTGSALEAVRKADDAVRPLIIGDPATHRDGLAALVRAYQAVKSAKTEADLQAAINAAVVKLSNLINAVKRR